MTEIRHSSPSDSRLKARSSKSRWAIGIALVALVVLVSRFHEVRSFLSAAMDWISGLEAWAPALFIVIYVLATVLFIPGTVLSLGAGAVFGVAYGSIYVSIASTIGAAFSFIIGRHFARVPIARRIEHDARFVAIDRAVADEGWKIVLLTRLSPIFPFTLLNYAFGVTRITFWHYVWASWCGMLPATVVYVYIGSLAKAGFDGQVRSFGEWVLYGIGVTAAIGVTWYVARIAHRALRDHVPH